MMAALWRHAALFQFALKESLAYRWDLVLAALLRFLPMVGTYLLWRAVYGSAPDRPRPYSFPQIVSYLLIVQGALIVSGMSGLAYRIARDIRSGAINHALLRPIGWIPALLARRAGEKLSEIAISAGPFLLVGTLVAPQMALPSGPTTWLAFGVSLLLGFLFSFALEMLLGLVAFWLLEIAAPIRAASAIIYILSGHLFPLDLLPRPLADAARLLPFQYLACFPATVFLERVSGYDLAAALTIQAAWCLLALAAADRMCRSGLRRHAAFGG